jgi:hypothetical protein
MIDDRPTLDKSMARVPPGDPRRTISRSGRPLDGVISTAMYTTATSATHGSAATACRSRSRMSAGAASSNGNARLRRISSTATPTARW